MEGIRIQGLSVCRREQATARTARRLGTALVVALSLTPMVVAAQEAGSADNATSREEAIDKIITACRENPQMGGCVKLRQACNDKRGQWKNDMARICPALVGGGGGQVEDISPADRDKAIHGCRNNPGQSSCAKLRDLCGRSYYNAGPNFQQFCRALSWQPGSGGGGGGGSAPMASAMAYTATWAKVVDPKAVKDNGSAVGIHLSNRGYSTDGPWAAVFDFTLTKADTGWYWDGTLQGGFGGWLSRKLAFGLTAGIRGSGLTGGGFGTAWGVPVELQSQVAVLPNLTLVAYARPTWHFGEAAGRKRVGTLVGFADEFEAGAHVNWARIRRAGERSAWGLIVGVFYAEIARTQFVGVRIGVGNTSRE